MKVLILLFGLAALATGKDPKASDHVQYMIRAGTVPARGVNLGGWLVTECWINPGDPMYDGVSEEVCNQGEYSVMKALGHAVGDARYENHWDTFITEADIAEIVSYGLNLVRVPIGYWIIGYDNHDPSNQQEWKTFAPGGLKYLDRLINEWSPRYNVSVLVDIHAAKGSQNGMDHSAPPVPGVSFWSQYQENIDSTIEVARFMAIRYRNSEAFLGVEMLNEPHNGVESEKLRQYYMTVHDLIRGTGDDCVLVVSPLLTEQNSGPPGYWDEFMRPPRYTNIWHDWHKYLMWGFEDKTPEWIMNEGVNLIRQDIANWYGNWLFMGEWSLGSFATFTDEQLHQYAINMIDAMKGMHSGWTMWTWKQGDGSPREDGEGGWCMRDLLRDKIITPDMWA